MRSKNTGARKALENVIHLVFLLCGIVAVAAAARVGVAAGTAVRAAHAAGAAGVTARIIADLND